MPDFIYCLNSSTIKPVPILDKIAIAAETGYAAIELWHDDIDAHLHRGGTLADVRKAVDDRGLTVPTTIFLKGWWDTTGDVYRRAMDENKRRMEQAAAVGAVHCIAGPPLGMVDRALGPRQYRALLEAGLQLGVKPSVEYLGFAEEINRIEDAVEIAAGSGHADATVVLDPFHCFRGGGSIEAIRQLRPEQIAISHFNDTPAFPPRELQHDPDRVLPGDGHLDLKRYVALLREIGFRGCLSLEVFNRELWSQNPREVARVGLEKMRAIAEE